GVGRRRVVLPLLRPPRAAGATLRGDPRLPGRRLAAAAADRGQDRADAAGEPAALRGDRPGGRTGAVVPCGVRAAGGGAGATDWGDEERLAGGSAVGVQLPGQRLPAAGAYGGLCHRGVIPGGSGGGAGGGDGEREHAAAAAVEGRRGAAGGSAAGVAAGVGHLAAPSAVAARVAGGEERGGPVDRDHGRPRGQRRAALLRDRGA